MKPLRDAHRESARFSPDPAYAAPDARTKLMREGIFSARLEGARWVYLFGDLAIHLFNRLRREAFATCRNVFHPGRFRSPQPTLHARTVIRLERRPSRATLTLMAAGQVSLFLNGELLLAREFTDARDAVPVDIRPLLRTGENRLGLIVCGAGAPATFRLWGGPLPADAEWEVSGDMVRWSAPEYVPIVPVGYPHEQQLPEIMLEANALGNGLYDFGVQTFGRVSVLGARTGWVTMQVGESIPETQVVKQAEQEQVIPAFEPVKRDGMSGYTCPANLSLRYVQLTGPAAKTAQRVRLAAPTYPVKYRGAFACSDEMLTQIWMRAAYTYRLCMRQLVVDGLKRDRLPWGGDLYMSGLVNNYSFAEHPLIQRSLYALYGEGPESMEVSGILDYSLFWVLALRDQVLHSGDRNYARRLLPQLERMLLALQRRCDDTGFLPTRPGDWVFIDWSEVEKAGYNSCVQMLYVMALDAAAELYALLDGAGQARMLRTQARTLRKRCNAAFWSTKDQCYVDNVQNGRQGGHRSRPPGIFAVLSGTADAVRRRLVLKNTLLRPAVIPVATPYMQTFEALALAACGSPEMMLERIRAEWGGMGKAGATTFWEGYDRRQTGPEQYAFYGRPFAKSLCHAWSAGPVYLLSQALTGARPLTPGWERFTLHPNIGGLEWAAVTLPCPQGEIQVSLERRDCIVRLPAGCTLVRPEGEHAGPCAIRL